MHVVFLGAPGVGKGTQSKKLAEWLQVQYLSTGDILRQAVEAQTDLGKMAKQIIEEGRLISDEVMLGIVEERISRNEHRTGFILDGFPRTLPQADGLNQLLSKQGQKLDKAFYLRLNTKTLINRLSGRLVSPNGREYHVVYNPPKTAGICDDCGESLIQRPDDAPDKVAFRIKTFEKQTLPLVEYYKSLGLLAEIDTKGKIEEVFQCIQTHFS